MNPEKVVALDKDPGMRRFFEGAFLVIPDGIGIVVALRLLLGVKAQRVAGADLMQELCGLAARRGYSVFLYGGTEEVSSRTAAELSRRHPSLKPIGRQNGFLDEMEMEAFVERLNEVRPDFLFVGLGSPRQERWIQRHLSRLEIGVCQGVGGTFDTIAGTVTRTPLFLRSLGLEWVYRVTTQPQRLRRAALAHPAFAVRVLARALLRKT